MVYVEYDKTNDRAKSTIEGSLGLICGELGLAICLIADNKELEMTTDDVIDCIKEAIQYKTNKENLVS